MATITVNKSNFEADVLQSSEPVVVDFWAEWCGPCKMIAPALEEISNEMKGKVKIAKLNIDENQELAAAFGVRSIPTLMIFKDGEVADIKVGALPKTALSHWINSSAGPIIRQGPHHSAQKSTTTGSEDWITSASKLESVTFTVAMALSFRRNSRNLEPRSPTGLPGA